MLIARDLRIEVGPRILIDDYGGSETSSMINPFALSDDDVRLVAEALFEALSAERPPNPEGAANACDVGGEWRVEIAFATGPAVHSLHLRRQGDALSGCHVTPYGDGEAEGTMTAGGFDLQVFHMVEGSFVSFRFVAETCTPDRLSGFVELGAAGSHTKGPTTLRQFGKVPFSAERP